MSAFGWMRYMLGCTGEELIADRARFVAAPPAGPASSQDGLVFQGAGAAWPAGRFEWPSVDELAARAGPAALAPAAKVPLVVVDGVDIGALQAELATDQQAMVQVASNFNTLENASRSVAADFGFLVTGYAVDATQGPAASFGVPMASLLRAHYPFHAPDVPAAGWGQTAARQVELPGDVAGHFGRCVNGKVTLTGAEAPIPAGGLAAVAGKIRVGLHTDAEVVFGRGSRRDTLRVLPAGARPRVDPVICASVNLRDPVGGRDAPNWDDLVRACLRAAYHAAYLAAIARGRKLLLLTLVGGGYFGNPERLILEAIADAHRQWAPRSALGEVCVCLYPKGTAAPTQAALDELLA